MCVGRQALLLDFKSEQIAEQMTLLDAELFMKIEIPEVLIWAQEQNEERSPNLTRFTEHFNKMSYWWDSVFCFSERQVLVFCIFVLLQFWGLAAASVEMVLLFQHKM